jgi:phosphoserine aminotransferase
MARQGYYFGAGPAALPDVILREAQAEFLDWRGLGLSVLEIGHRTEEFTTLLFDAEADLRDLLDIPANYHVLFLGGAARTQFSMVPMNLLAPGKQAGYLISGLWSRLAYEEAKRLGTAYVIPSETILQYEENTAYVYYTPNETVDGVYYSDIPDVGNIPLIADMTSCLLTEPVDVRQFGLIFAGAQKNIAPAGLTLVIVRDDLLKICPKQVVPTMLDYRVHAAHRSLYATPPVFQCDMAARMLRWIKAQGGLQVLYQLGCEKAAKLYAYIDASSEYVCSIKPNLRSRINVCFTLKDETQELGFLRAAERRNLRGLKGHRLRGGLRASLYNAMPMAGVDALIGLMDDFVRGAEKGE